MEEKLNILYLEDNPLDAELVQATLEGGGIECAMERVETCPDYLAALEKGGFQLIFADYSLPSFDGLSALKLTHDKPYDIPFIFISGNSGEDVAIEAVKSGATDYVLKQKLSRLIPVVRRALKEAEAKAERKHAEDEVRKVNRALKVLSVCNHAVIHSDDESSLLNEVCGTIVEVGGYRLAWVWYIERDQVKSVCSIAYGGCGKESFGNIELAWMDNKNGPNPAVSAIKMGRNYIIRDILTDENFVPLRDEALKLGYASFIAIPLRVGEEVVGALNIYAEEPNAFDIEEVNLLEQLASDLSFGIVTLRIREERQHAEEKLKKSSERLKKVMEGTIHAIGLMCEIRDPYTAGHSRRVALLSCAIAKEMGLSEDMIEEIDVIGHLHDIGKLVVPAEILSKPGKINEHEFSIIKDHPTIGYEILSNIDFPWPVAKAVLQHHEKLNRSGYPAGLFKDEILLEAKILTVADVVESILSHRPYRAALGVDRALEEISLNKGKFYDPDAVDACIKLFKEKDFRFVE